MLQTLIAMAASPPALQTGQIIAGKFRVGRLLGLGGMGMVVSARHLVLDQDVALKLMLPERARDHGAVGRFLREARAAARLKSEHVTRVLDVGTVEQGPYIVMELLEGTDLATSLRRSGPVPVGTAAALIAQICEGIAEAHDRGIVHRDLKPSNLFATSRRGRVVAKVLDLGICRLMDGDADLRGTSASVVLGTPAYMAPEQMRSANAADARSDIWSLGVILYELVSGRVPFPADTLPEQCVRSTLDPYPRLQRDDIPAGFDALIARCLEKDPAARFGSAAELASALAPFSGDIAISLLDAEGAAAVQATASTAQHEIASIGATRAYRRKPTPAEDEPAPAEVASPVDVGHGRRIGWFHLSAAIVVVAAVALMASALSPAIGASGVERRPLPSIAAPRVSRPPFAVTVSSADAALSQGIPRGDGRQDAVAPAPAVQPIDRRRPRRARSEHSVAEKSPDAGMPSAPANDLEHLLATPD